MDSDRQTGKTTRILLRALLAASEGERRVSIMVPTHSMAQATFERLTAFAEPISGCEVKLWQQLVLPNGCVVEVVPVSSLDKMLERRGCLHSVLLDEVAAAYSDEE